MLMILLMPQKCMECGAYQHTLPLHMRKRHTYNKFEHEDKSDPFALVFTHLENPAPYKSHEYRMPLSMLSLINNATTDSNCTLPFFKEFSLPLFRSPTICAVFRHFCLAER